MASCTLEDLVPLVGSVGAAEAHAAARRDEMIARAVRLEPRSAVRAAFDAARDPSRPPLSPAAIPGLRTAFHRLGPYPSPEVDVAALDIGQVGLAATRSVLARAVPFLVPHEQSAMICDSEPPDARFFEDARLPYPAVSLWFARPVELPAPIINLGTSFVLGVAVVADDPAGAGIAAPAAWLLLGEDDGRLKVAACPVATWRASQPADVLANAVAAITALPFTPPPPYPPDIDDSTPGATRSALRSKQARRAIERGAITGVHVLDVPRLGSQASVDSALVADYLASRRSVRAHWRRGHWQRYRLARRGPAGEIVGDIQGERGIDWDYQLRWVAPVRVNAARDQPHDDGAVGVYRLRDQPRSEGQGDAGGR